MSQDRPPIPLRELASLAAVRGELDRVEESTERRTASVDTKSGLLLGVSGVLVGLGQENPGAWELISHVVAVAAGGLAVWAFWPRVGGSLNSRRLRDKYLTQPEPVTQLVVLDSRIVLLEDDERQLHAKLRRLKAALFTLAVAVTLLVIGSIVKATA